MHHESSDGGGRHLLHDPGRQQGQVHPLPRCGRDLRGGEVETYEIGGRHFGDKPTDRSNGCCGDDYHEVKCGTYVTNEDLRRGAQEIQTTYKCEQTECKNADAPPTGPATTTRRPS